MQEPPRRPLIATAPLSVVLTAHDPAAELEQTVTAWTQFLDGLKRDYEMLLVSGGGSDETTRLVDALVEPGSHSRVLHHATPGLGASLRTGIAAARFPLVFTATADRVVPADLERMLGVIDEVDIVAGYRVGRSIPGWLKALDVVYRAFMRALFGMPVEPRQCWRGWSGWGRRRLARLLFGVRVKDPECTLRLFRRSVFKRLPLQSDSSFALIEMLAKANFLGCLMAEVPVSESTDEQSTDAGRTYFQDRRRVFANADFGPAIILPGEESFATLPAAAAPSSGNEEAQTMPAGAPGGDSSNPP
jgi:hypothetical protein